MTSYAERVKARASAAMLDAYPGAAVRCWKCDETFAFVDVVGMYVFGQEVDDTAGFMIVHICRACWGWSFWWRRFWHRHVPPGKVSYPW